MAENQTSQECLTMVAHLLTKGYFQYRHLNEAHLLAEYLAQACPNPRLATVGIKEILLNAIEHGNLGITSDEKAALQQQGIWIEEIERRLKLPEHIDQIVKVEFTRFPTEIHIKVIDEGSGFNWQNEINGDLCATHGRGLFIAKNLSFKRLDYSAKGNEVTCVIDLYTSN